MSDKPLELPNLTVLNKDMVMKSENLCGESGCHVLRYSRNLVQVGALTHLCLYPPIGPLTRDNMKVEATGPKPCSYSRKATDDEGLKVPVKEHGGFAAASLLALRRLPVSHLNFQVRSEQSWPILVTQNLSPRKGEGLYVPKEGSDLCWWVTLGHRIL